MGEKRDEDVCSSGRISEKPQAYRIGYRKGSIGYAGKDLIVVEILEIEV